MPGASQLFCVMEHAAFPANASYYCGVSDFGASLEAAFTVARPFGTLTQFLRFFNINGSLDFSYPEPLSTFSHIIIDYPPVVNKILKYISTYDIIIRFSIVSAKASFAEKEGFPQRHDKNKKSATKMWRNIQCSQQLYHPLPPSANTAAPAAGKMIGFSIIKDHPLPESERRQIAETPGFYSFALLFTPLFPTGHWTSGLRSLNETL